MLVPSALGATPKAVEKAIVADKSTPAVKARCGSKRDAGGGFDCKVTLKHKTNGTKCIEGQFRLVSKSLQVIPDSLRPCGAPWTSQPVSAGPSA